MDGSSWDVTVVGGSAAGPNAALMANMALVTEDFDAAVADLEDVA